MGVVAIACESVLKTKYTYLTARQHLRGAFSLVKDALLRDFSMAPDAAPADIGASLNAVSAPRAQLTLHLQVGLRWDELRTYVHTKYFEFS